MFSVHCEGHGTEVLLSTDHIEGVVNHGHVIELRWRCDRGHRGSWLIERAAARA